MQALWAPDPGSGEPDRSSPPGQGQDSGEKGSQDSQKENALSEPYVTHKLSCDPAPPVAQQWHPAALLMC